MYEGSCVHGIPEGKGTMTYWNHCTWEGEWKNGERNGRGVYHYSESVWFEGVWKDNHLVTQGSLMIENDVYSNTSKLFVPNSCTFSFMSEKELILCLYPIKR